MTVIWKNSPKSFLSLTSYWTRPSRNTANTYLKANARNPVCDLSLCLTKVLSTFCSKYKDLSYICTLIKFKSMLTKVIEQAKIDHFSKWFERADKRISLLPGIHRRKSGKAFGTITFTVFSCESRKWYNPNDEPIASPSGETWDTITILSDEGSVHFLL